MTTELDNEITPENIQRWRTAEEEILEDLSKRDEILHQALAWAERNVSYVPLAVEEDISQSYADDPLPEFEQTVRRWCEALRDAEMRRSA